MASVSVILACYNAAATLSQALDTLFSQTHDDFEVILVDGGSRDDTSSVVRRYPVDKIRYVSEEDSGIYDAFNKGIGLARGDWLYFMGADDRLNDDHVFQEMIGSDEKIAPYDVIIGDIRFDNQRIRKSRISAGTRLRNTVHHQSAFYRRELFRSFRYNADYSVSADYELNLRIFLEKRKVLKADKIVSVVALGGVSSQVAWSGYLEEIQIRNKYLQKGLLRGVMNLFTCTRYVVKKVGLLFGRTFHYYS